MAQNCHYEVWLGSIDKHAERRVGNFPIKTDAYKFRNQLISLGNFAYLLRNVHVEESINCAEEDE